MSIIGWYYLHTNGSLIYKRELDGDTSSDIRESPFAVAMWPVHENDRENAWTILVEALSLGVDSSRINELATKWNCTNDDALIYAKRIGLSLNRDGFAYLATASSTTGCGNTYLEAMADLCKKLGYKGGKMWTVTFKDLLRKHEEKSTDLQK